VPTKSYELCKGKQNYKITKIKNFLSTILSEGSFFYKIVNHYSDENNTGSYFHHLSFIDYLK